mmetsp:Transcript_31522/g.61718  ORF Transcript_31522/g.61718 Transcript_31522/m.61718 type:complete len:399 (-) Transcript_31522:167-1363(-)
MSIILNTFRSSPERVFRIWLIRHGESLGNVNPSVYKQMPDHKIPLTERGLDMARTAGDELAATFSSTFEDPSQMGHCRMWVSPFQRTRQTAKAILESPAGEWVSDVKESPFLVEQDWGLFEGTGIDDASEHYPDEWKRLQKLRDHQGKFWARMPMGESCFDVCTRVSNFFSTTARDRSPKWFKGRPGIDNIIVVSHGVTIRSFIMMWCNFSPEWFEVNVNPPNCSVLHIEDSVLKGYVFPGYGENAKALGFDQVGIAPDPSYIELLEGVCKGETCDPYHWTNKDTGALHDFFNAMDDDRNGVISVQEAKKHLGPHGSSGLLQKAGNNKLDFEKMLELFKEDCFENPPPIPYHELLAVATRVAKGQISKEDGEKEYVRLAELSLPRGRLGNGKDSTPGC